MIDCSKRTVPRFYNYTWDLVEKRLFSGFASDRETASTEHGYFILKKNGKRYSKTSDQLDLMCGINEFHRVNEYEQRLSERKRRKV
jgi:hypothetical protein